MTLEQQWNTAANTTFSHRVQQAAVKAAIAVASEDAQTANHAKRLAFGNVLLRSPEAWGRVIAYGVLTNAAVSEASSDSDIEFTVNSMWNAYAVDAVT